MLAPWVADLHQFGPIHVQHLQNTVGMPCDKANRRRVLVLVIPHRTGQKAECLTVIGAQNSRALVPGLTVVSALLQRDAFQNPCRKVARRVVSLTSRRSFIR